MSDILVYRYIFGFEKTFDNGNASIGVRLPLDQLTANTRVPARFKQIGGTSTALDDMNIFSKFILRQNPQTGSLISVGLSITPTTGGGNFAGAKFIQYINTTEIQPFVAYIWNRGNFYIQGFSAFEFPVNQNQVTEMYNDIGMGYFVYRANDPCQLITAVVPTFEVHVNSPLNHRGFDNPNELSGTPDVVNLTYGLNVEFDRNSLLTFGFVTPVTGPGRSTTRQFSCSISASAVAQFRPRRRLSRVEAAAFFYFREPGRRTWARGPDGTDFALPLDVVPDVVAKGLPLENSRVAAIPLPRILFAPLPLVG